MARGKKSQIKEQISYITAEGLAGLKKEYENRKSVLRDTIAQKIDEARRYGDLSENNAYTSAMEEKDFNEARLLELEQLIQSSRVAKNNHDGKITLGNRVHLKGKSGITIYKIVGAEEADPTKSFISDQSPLGRSLLGKKEGDKVNLALASGNVSFTVVKVD